MYGMPNWSEPKITNSEKIKIDPYESIAQAEEYAESGDYHRAESSYIVSVKNARGTASQADIVAKAKSGLAKIYDSWAAHCCQNYEFEEAELVLNKSLKVSPDIRDVQTDLRALYMAWGDRLIFEGKLEGAETRYIRALQMDRELNKHFIAPITLQLIQKIKEIKYAYNSIEEKQLAYSLYVLEQGKSFRVKSVILGIIGVICIISAISFHGNEDVFWMVLAIMFISPIVVPVYSFNYERQLTRGKVFASLLHMFFWTIIGALCCAIDPLYAFYPAIVGVFCVSHALKMRKTRTGEKLYSKTLKELVSNMESKKQVDITVTHSVQDEKQKTFKDAANRAAGLGIRLLVRYLCR